MLIKFTTILISFATLAGVLLHDTQLEKLAAVAIGLPAIMVAYGGVDAAFKTSEHTHVERVSLSHRAMEARGLQPRTNEDKRYRLGKHVGKGHHAFDNYNLPIVA